MVSWQAELFHHDVAPPPEIFKAGMKKDGLHLHDVTRLKYTWLNVAT
jgi:hypothetical protein